MSDAIERHIAELRFRNRRPSTICTRHQILTQAQDQIGRPLITADTAALIGWLGRPLAANSRRAYRSHLVGFFGWARRDGLRADDPTEAIPTVKAPRRLPRPLPDHQVAQAVAYGTPTMRAWILLMAGAGLRCIEVAALEPRDVRLQPIPTLVLRETKGGIEQTVPLHPSVLAALEVLPIRNGLWWNVSRERVSYQVGAYLRSLGIRGSAHQLRHSAITTWYEVSGHDLVTTQRLARHADLSSTQIYADIAPERPAEVVAAVRLPEVGQQMDLFGRAYPASAA